MNKQSQLTIFISHSAKDEKLASALVNLLRNALNIPASKIRCTSVNGYRLKAGADTEDVLKAEVTGAKAFIGLITPSSIASAYVLFELGARWGVNQYLVPLLGAGAGTESLKGPLSSLNALKCEDTSQVHQLVQNLHQELKIQEPLDAAVYANFADDLIQASKAGHPTTQMSDQKMKVLLNAVGQPIAPEKPIVQAERQEPAKIIKKLSGPPPTKPQAGISPTHIPKSVPPKARLEKIEEEILRLFANSDEGVLTKDEICIELKNKFGRHRLVAERHIDHLVDINYIACLDELGSVFGTYDLKKLGRNYLIDNNLI